MLESLLVFGPHCRSCEVVFGFGNNMKKKKSKGCGDRGGEPASNAQNDTVGGIVLCVVGCLKSIMFVVLVVVVGYIVWLLLLLLLHVLLV